MAGGAGQARAAVLVERVVVLLLESLRGVGGSRAQGLRQLPVVEGAAVPRHPGLRREGVAGLRQLPLKPGGEGRGITEKWGSALPLWLHPQQAGRVPQKHSHHRGSSHGAQKPCAPQSAEDPKMGQQDSTWAIRAKHSGLQVSGEE